jgi:hypothetical protein
MSEHGTAVSGVLIAQYAYFKDLAEGSPLLWRLSVEFVDGWTVSESAATGGEENGPFAWLLGA